MSDDDSQKSYIFESMFRLSARLKESKSSEEAFAVIADEIRSITNADYSGVYLVEKDRKALTLVGWSGVETSKVKDLPDIKVDEAFRKKVSGPGQPAVFRLEFPGDVPETTKPLAKALDIQYSLVCPAVLRGEMLGYLSVSRKRGSEPFTPDAEKGFGAVSVGIGLLMENVRIYASMSKEKERTERILALAPIGILICDPKGIFKSLNMQMLGLLDRESDSELVGTSVFEIPALNKSGIDALLLQAMEGHQGEKADVHLVLRSDKAYYLHVKVTPIRSEKGETEGILLVAMDVTSKIRLQNQLERSYEKLTQTYQELERVTKMKTQFIDVVSHELRTPLTVMRGYIDLVESEYSSQLDPKFGSRLRIIKANTDKLYGLVENMLDVSRLEKGSMQIHPEPVRIDTILEEILHVRVHDAEEKKQTLSLDVEGKMPLIMADRRRLKDVFNSLVDNALKYTQDGGRIQVSARDEGKMIHVWVKDNGVGIPLENLGKIFDRFHIVTSNELSHQVDRLGLGLPISKGIVEAHGGRIWVESQVGKGSVFHVDLPKEQPRSA